MTATAPAFRKGGEGAAEASKSQSFARGNRIGYLSLDANEKVIVRYITEYADWIYVAQHSSCPTKNKPQGFDGKWPQAMTAICRYDPAFEGIYSDCYICDAEIQNKYGKRVSNATRIWALAVEREEVIGDGSDALGGPDMKGKRVGCTDVMEEVDEVGPDGKETGNKIVQRKYVIVNFAHKNFFSGLAACNSEYGSTTDRDYRITRTGAETDTIYSHFPLAETPNLKPGTPKWQEKYLDDLAAREIDLGTIVAEKASDDFYARFFDPTKTVKPRGKDGKDGEVETEVVSTAEVEAEQAESDAEREERVKALRARVQGVASTDID